MSLNGGLWSRTEYIRVYQWGYITSGSAHDCGGSAVVLSALHRASIGAILIAVSSKRRVATMASKTSPDPAWTGRRIDFPTFCAELSARRAAAGDPPVPRNAGNNRTASKRALLKAIEEAGGKW